MTDIIQRLVNITSHYPRYFLMFGSSYINISDLIAPGCICFLRLFTSNKHSLKFSKARMTELIFTILLKSISITKTAYSNILKILPPKNGNFSDKKNLIFFTFLLKNIDCGYSLEPPHRGVSYEYSLEPPRRGGSNEYPQSMFLFKNIDCGYSLEPPRRGGSNEYPQPMFLSRNNKNNVYPCKPQFYYTKVGFKGIKII